MKRFLVPFVLLILAACAQAPIPGDEALPNLAPVTLGSSDEEKASGLAKHSSGVYVVGDTNGSLYGTYKSGIDGFLGKFSTSGAELWGKQFGTSSADRARSVASDGSNNAYVVGYTNGNLAGSRGLNDAFVRKYNSSGGISWTRQFGTSADDDGYGIATYGSNAVYVVGGTTGNLAGSKGGEDTFIRKYSSSGSVLWTRQFGTSQDERALDVAVDGSGNAYVVGYTFGSLGAPNGGKNDMFIRRYNASGSVAWTRQMPTGNYDPATGVAVTGSSVYLVSQFLFDANIDNFDVRLAKYSTSGAFLWQLVFGSVSIDLVDDVSADSSGVVISGGTKGSFDTRVNQGKFDGFVMKFDSSGGFLWNTQQGTAGDDGTAAVLLRSGQVYAAGSTQGALGATNHGALDAFLRRMSGSTGATVWTDQ